MARGTAGWQLLVRDGIYAVRFRAHGKRHVISTGKRDAREAAELASQIYSNTITRKRVAVVKRRAEQTLDVLVVAWLTDREHDLAPNTIDEYLRLAKANWLKRWTRIEQISGSSLETFVRDRLAKVTRESVRKELVAMRSLLTWGRDHGVYGELPEFPVLRKGALGTRSGKQRIKAKQLTEDQVWALLWAITDPVIRAYYVFMYETALRPSTLDKLQWSDLDGQMLHIRAETDKARYDRLLPLSALARECLRWVSRFTPSNALIFGKHDRRKHWGRAVEQTAKFNTKGAAPYDLRHARATHLLDRGASLSATAYLLGHKQMTTTNTYAHGTLQQAALAVLGSNWDQTIKQTGSNLSADPVFSSSGREDSNLRPPDPQAASELRNPRINGLREFIAQHKLLGFGTTSRASGISDPSWFTMAAAWLATRRPELVEAWQ